MAMERGVRCTRHRTAEASFCCDRCGDPYCQECRCELLNSDICCAECAVETAGESRGEFQGHHGDGYAAVAGTPKKPRRGRFLTIMLLVCLPLLGAEFLFLHRSTHVNNEPETVVRRVMADTLVLVTQLNRYKAEDGQYPEQLDQIIPNYWEPGDSVELERYEYRRAGTDRFVLRPRLSGSREEDAGIIKVLALLPDSLGEDSPLDIFLRRDQGRSDRSAAGDGA